MATIQARKNNGGDTAYRAIIRRAGYATMTATFGTREEADFWAAGIEKAINEKRDVTGGEVTLATPVRAMLAKFVREVTPTKRGARQETQMINALLERFRVFDKTLADFGPRDLEAVIAARLKGSADYPPVNPATVRRELGMLSGAFNHAIKKWHVAIAVNPCSMVDRPKSNPHRTHRISDALRAEVCLSLGYREGETPVTRSQWVAWSFCFALATCMRRGEVLGARWEHYDGNKTLFLPATKNGEARNVSINAKARALLALVENKGSGPVVPVNVSTFANIWNKAKKGTSREWLHFHDTRHEGTTRYSKVCPTVLHLQKITGHKDIRSLEIYFHPETGEIADLMDQAA